MAGKFVELRAHTAFSFGDGSATPEALVEAASRMGYTALGLTDTADFGGVVRFAIAAWGAGIAPIIGAELNVDGHPVALLARTAEGCHNLAGLITQSRAGCLRSWERAGDPDGHNGRRRVRGGRGGGGGGGKGRGAESGRPERGRPRVSWQDVANRSAGLFALTGPASGLLATSVRSGDSRAAARHLAIWQSVFSDRLAVEVQIHHAGRTEAALAGALMELAERAGVHWVVANNPRYVSDEGRLIHDVLTALRAGVDLDTAAIRGVLHPNGGWLLRSPAEMASL